MQTLGSVQNISSLPQPSSALKRTSSIGFNGPFTSQNTRSMSLMNSSGRPQQPNFQRSSSGGAALGADAGLSSVRRSVSSNMFHGAGRPSLAPAQAGPSAQNLQRRSSVFSRPSMGMGGAHGRTPVVLYSSPQRRRCTQGSTTVKGSFVSNTDWTGTVGILDA